MAVSIGFRCLVSPGQSALCVFYAWHATTLGVPWCGRGCWNGSSRTSIVLALAWSLHSLGFITNNPAVALSGANLIYGKDGKAIPNRFRLFPWFEARHNLVVAYLKEKMGEQHFSHNIYISNCTNASFQLSQGINTNEIMILAYIPCPFIWNTTILRSQICGLISYIQHGFSGVFNMETGFHRQEYSVHLPLHPYCIPDMPHTCSRWLLSP